MREESCLLLWFVGSHRGPVRLDHGTPWAFVFLAKSHKRRPAWHRYRTLGRQASAASPSILQRLHSCPQPRTDGTKVSFVRSNADFALRGFQFRLLTNHVGTNRYVSRELFEKLVDAFPSRMV